MTLLEEHLSKLCEELQLSSVAFEPNATIYPLEINDQTTIQVKNYEPGVFFQANITECPKEHLEELFTYLMRANLLGQGTGAAVIGMDEREKFLTLSLCLPYEMNYREFRDNLEDFVNYLVYWREEVIELQKK